MLWVVPDPDLHGAQRTLLTLLTGLDRAQFECHIVLPFEGSFADEAARLGHSVHVRNLVRWVPSAKKLRRVGLLRYLMRFVVGLHARAAALADLVGRLNIDVVVTNTVACVEGALGARMAAVPHVWHIHESIAGNPALRRIAPTFVYRLVMGVLSRELVFVSASVAAGYGRLARRGRVIHPGIAMLAPPDRDAARRHLQQVSALPPHARLVGVVGALQPGKDHATFLGAARRVHDVMSDVHFLIVGTGGAEYTAEVESMIRTLGLGSCAKLLGWWPAEDIHRLMAGLDVLVISSVQESFGLTAVEALAAGTPVVATRCGGPAEVIRDGVDGRLVPVGNTGAMARAVLATLAEPAIARAQARSGRERVGQQFSQERYVDAMQQVISDVSCNDRSGRASTSQP